MICILAEIQLIHAEFNMPALPLSVNPSAKSAAIEIAVLYNRSTAGVFACV